MKPVIHMYDSTIDRFNHQRLYRRGALAQPVTVTREYFFLPLRYGFEFNTTASLAIEVMFAVDDNAAFLHTIRINGERFFFHANSPLVIVYTPDILFTLTAMATVICQQLTGFVTLSATLGRPNRRHVVQAVTAAIKEITHE